MSRATRSLGIDWFLPGARKRFATTTKASSDLIVLVSEQGLTVAESVDLILYDPEAKAVLEFLAEHGQSGTRLADLVGGHR